MATRPKPQPSTETASDWRDETSADGAFDGASSALFDAAGLFPPDEETIAEATPCVALDDAARKRRAKALSCIAPVILLEERKAHRGMQDYDLQELALAAIELVVDAMTFEGGATSEQVLRGLVPLVAAQQWGRSIEEQHRVAEAVIETLIVPYSGAYGDYRGEDYVRRRYDVQLVREEEGADGIHLRATDEAINAIVGALDVDIESAQHAAEEMLRNLVTRGRLDAAVQVASDARRRSIQYAEKIRQLLALTARNVAAVDWVEGAPQLISDALDHLSERLALERTIIRNLEERRAGVGDDSDAIDSGRIARLVALLEDCTRRHTFLQGRVMDARETFLHEQERQSFMPFVSLQLFEPDEDLLRPILSAPLGEIADPLGKYFSRAAGVASLRLARLSVLLPMLLREPLERDELGEDVGDLEFVENDEIEEVFDMATWQAVDLILARVQQETRLSQLLAEGRLISAEVADLLRLRVLHAFAPALGVPADGETGSILLARDHGSRLDDQVFAGADLLVSWIERVLPADAAEEPVTESDPTDEFELELVEEQR